MMNEMPKNFFPSALADWKYKERSLWYAGDLSLLEWPCVSVIGSRDISEIGQQRALKLTSILVKRGYCIVSGLAAGVDSIAHRAALELGGKTIAVMGTPLDKCYPAENKDLKEKIEKFGLVLSQFPIGEAVNKGNFPKRNMLMAALSEASIVVEAGEKSGTRHQVEAALKIGRKVGFLKSLADRGYSWVSDALNSSHDAFVISNPEDLGILLLPHHGSSTSYQDISPEVSFAPAMAIGHK